MKKRCSTWWDIYLNFFDTYLFKGLSKQRFLFPIMSNKILKEKGYDYEVKVISPWAEGPKQMFDLIRGNKCDIAFLTLFFIKMDNLNISELLLPINTNSPRLINYKYLLPDLTKIPMGMDNEKCLYIPWGGGAYGFYANMTKLKVEDLPLSVGDLLKPKWKDKYSLNLSQSWYNTGLIMMSMGNSPFKINELILKGKRNEAKILCNREGEVQKRLTKLYEHAGHLWTQGPEFKDNLLIVSSWGPEVGEENKKGKKWDFIQFKEGNMVWLDTINFVKGLSGKKLEAAEIFANYFIGEKIQNRIVNELSMVASSSLASSNILIEKNPDFFSNERFMPPLNKLSDNLNQKLTSNALKEAGKKID